MLYRAKTNGDEGVKACKIIGKNIPLGYEKTESFFVDNSGFGTRGEAALVFADFVKQVKAGRYYGITEAGQFQVYIAEFKKVSRSAAFEAEGIARSRLISKSCRVIDYKNGDKTIRLYATDIIQFKGDKIILSSGGIEAFLSIKRRGNGTLTTASKKIYHFLTV